MRVARRLSQRGLDRLGACIGNNGAEALVAYELIGAAYGGDDCGGGARRSLEQGCGETFRPGGQRHRVGLRHERCHVLPSQSPNQMDVPTPDPLDVPLLGTCACDDKMHGSPVRIRVPGDRRRGLGEFNHAFFGNEAPREGDHEGI